jgi:hypothetical protein
LYPANLNLKIAPKNPTLYGQDLNIALIFAGKCNFL